MSILVPMMGNAPIQQELQALEALKRLFAEAKKVQELFKKAGMAPPPSIAGILGGGSDDSPHGSKLGINSRVRRPNEVEDDSIAIPIKELQATSLVRGVLKGETSPIPTKSVLQRVQRLRPDVSVGTIYNVGARLDGKVIERSDAGWRLIYPNDAPLLRNEYAWGPASVFNNKQELAVHRRILICDLLRQSAAGLMVMQIVRQLETDSSCQAPVTKDLVKVDMQALKDEGLIRRLGNSRKWTLKEAKK